MSDDLKGRKRKRRKSKTLANENPALKSAANEEPQFAVTAQVKRNVPITQSRKLV